MIDIWFTGADPVDSSRRADYWQGAAYGADWRGIIRQGAARFDDPGVTWDLEQTYGAVRLSGRAPTWHAARRDAAAALDDWVADLVDELLTLEADGTES